MGGQTRVADRAAMAVGKNKRLTKGGGKKGQKKKTGDPFMRKEWFDVKAPAMFSKRSCGKTVITKSSGTRIATEELKGRIMELNLGDLNGDDDLGYRKIKLCVEEVQGRNCLTDFHGMNLTRDKICFLIKKWCTLIEAFADVKTTDGYVARLFVIGFTTKAPDQVKANCYAQTSKIKKIRKMMVTTMHKEAGSCALRELVKKLTAEVIGKEIEKRSQSLFPLKDVYVRKVKIVKKPKFDITKLMELHTGGDADESMDMVRPEAEEAQNTLTAELAGAEAAEEE